MPATTSPLLKYPENITARNLAYFLAVPTLCYQVCVGGRGLRCVWCEGACVPM